MIQHDLEINIVQIGAGACWHVNVVRRNECTNGLHSRLIKKINIYKSKTLNEIMEIKN